MIKLAILAVFFVGGLAAAWVSDYRKIRRRLGETPTVRIAELADDQLGNVVGRTRRLDAILEAPLTGRRCLYFLVIVEARHTSHGISEWSSVIREEHGVTFMLEDDSGRALIDATAAQIEKGFAKTESGMFDDPTPIEQAILDRHGVEGKGALLNRTLRYREAVIEEGETIAVLGAGTREPDPDAPPSEAYRGDAPTRLRLTSTPKYPLVISDPRTTRT